MKMFIDLEFIERGHRHPIDLISIGIVSSDGREYYAVSTEFNPRHASQWVKDNVIACLPTRRPGFSLDGAGSPREWEESRAWKSRKQIKRDLAEFFNCESFTKKIWRRHGIIGFGDRLDDSENTQYALAEGVDSPQIWGEWSAYDWVCFAQIFGTMMDLPQGFPMRVRDIIQLAEDELGIPSDRLPPSLETEGNHNALLGARTVKMRYEWLQSQRS